MWTFFRNVHQSARSLAKSPGFTLAAVFTLALGIGANTAVFSVVDAVVLRPLPYRDADRLVMVWDQLLKLGLDQFPVSFANYDYYRRDNRAFDDVAAFRTTDVNLEGSANAAPERLQAMAISSNLFPLLGASPALGGPFLPDQNTPGRDAAVILSDGLWRSRFGAEPGIIGQSIVPACASSSSRRTATATFRARIRSRRCSPTSGGRQASRGSRSSGLADTEILDLLSAAAGYEVGDAGVALAQMLRHETEGNPFFVVELLRHLGESGELVPDERGRYALRTGIGELALPSSVRDVVARRVARLGDETLQALSVAAVIGRDFDFASLVEVTGADRDALLDLLDGAVVASLVSEDRDVAGRYRFVHALIQHTLYDDLSATRRQRWHERVAQVLEAQGAEAAVQARHWVAATQPTDTAKALEYARRAGDDALAALSPDDAVRWYRQALELLDRQREPDRRERCRLLFDLGRAESEASNPDFWAPVMEAGRIARQLGDTDLLVRAALTRGSTASGIEFADPERLELLEFALLSVGEADSPERAGLLAGIAEELDPSDWRRRLESVDEAMAIARRSGDDASLLAILTRTGYVAGLPDRLERRHADVTVGLELAERTNDVISAFDLHMILHQTALVRGDLVAADVHLHATRAIVEATGLLRHEYPLRCTEGMRMLLHGRLAECELALGPTLELGYAARECGRGCHLRRTSDEHPPPAGPRRRGHRLVRAHRDREPEHRRSPQCVDDGVLRSRAAR